MFGFPSCSCLCSTTTSSVWTRSQTTAESTPTNTRDIFTSCHRRPASSHRRRHTRLCFNRTQLAGVNVLAAPVTVASSGHFRTSLTIKKTPKNTSEWRVRGWSVAHPGLGWSMSPTTGALESNICVQLPCDVHTSNQLRLKFPRVT